MVRICASCGGVCHAQVRTFCKRCYFRKLRIGELKSHFTVPVPIPSNGDPLIRQFIALFNGSTFTKNALCHKAGVAHNAFSRMLKRRNINLVDFQAMLGALGYELILKQKEPSNGKTVTKSDEHSF